MHYDDDASLRETWDEIQGFFMCCGAIGPHGHLIWLNILSDQESVPQSCCIEPFDNCGKGILQDTDQVQFTKVL
jgi:hypothetical protein